MRATSFNANASLPTAFWAGQAVPEPAGNGKQHCRFVGIHFNAIARTGFPVNVLVNRSAASVPDGNTTDQRPDLVPGVSLTPPGGKSIGQWINPAAFATPANGTFGNAPRDIARGPGAWQIDLGVNKRIPLSERDAA